MEAKNTGVEIQLKLQAALDVLCDPEAMLLFLKGHIRHGNPLCPQCFDHHLRLVGGNHLILQSMEEDAGARKLIQVIDR